MEWTRNQPLRCLKRDPDPRLIGSSTFCAGFGGSKYSEIQKLNLGCSASLGSDFGSFFFFLARSGAEVCVWVAQNRQTPQNGPVEKGSNPVLARRGAERSVFGVAQTKGDPPKWPKAPSASFQLKKPVQETRAPCVETRPLRICGDAPFSILVRSNHLCQLAYGLRRAKSGWGSYN